MQVAPEEWAPLEARVAPETQVLSEHMLQKRDVGLQLKLKAVSECMCHCCIL